MYPKHYAKVIMILDQVLIVAPGMNGKATMELHLRARNGWGHCGSNPELFSFPKGTVVKVYQRPQDKTPHFRRIGS